MRMRDAEDGKFLNCGFFATRVVKAKEETAAVERAKALILKELADLDVPALADVVLRVEEVTVVDGDLKAGGFSFFPEASH